MKKTLASLMVGMALTTGAYATPLQDWSVTLGSTTMNVSSSLSWTGFGMVVITGQTGSDFTWKEYGVMNVTGTDNSDNFALDSGREMTGVFQLSGVGSFTTGTATVNGGYVDLYAQDYAGATKFGNIVDPVNTSYGAGDGDLIGQFTVKSGSIDDLSDAALPVPTANTDFDVTALADSLASGVFTDDLWGDLASHILGGGITFGFVTGDAELQNPLPPNLADSLFALALADDVTGVLGQNAFIIKNNGNIKFDVPEPGTLALLGVGLLGAGVARRRKVVVS